MKPTISLPGALILKVARFDTRKSNCLAQHSLSIYRVRYLLKEILRRKAEFLETYYISGASSGLGKFLLGSMDSRSIDPRKSELVGEDIKSSIIHCAYSFPPISDTSSVLRHIKNMSDITTHLISQCKGKFVLMSTIDVYPKYIDKRFQELGNIDLRDITGPHGFVKYHLEQIVRKMTNNFAIIRLGMLVHEDSRTGTVKKILSGDPTNSNLDAGSTFALVRYETVRDLLEAIFSKDFVGTVNLAGQPPLSLYSMANLAKNTGVAFGREFYISPEVSLHLATELLGYEPPTSSDVALQTIESFMSKRI